MEYRKLTELTMDEIATVLDKNPRFMDSASTHTFDDTDRIVKDDMFGWCTFSFSNNYVGLDDYSIGYDRGAFIKVLNVEMVYDAIKRWDCFSYIDEDKMNHFLAEFIASNSEEDSERTRKILKECSEFLEKCMLDEYREAFENDVIIDFVYENYTYTYYCNYFVDEDFNLYEEKPVMKQIGVEYVKIE